jgi:uncharacterized protein (DUF302 family)
MEPNSVLFFIFYQRNLLLKNALNMDYFFSSTLNSGFDETIALVTEALKKEGFGIVSRIDMHDRFKEKLGVDFKKYTILGACNPSYAYKALQTEDKIGTMLPCNVVVIEKENRQTEVAAIDAVASMTAVGNSDLKKYAGEVAAIFQKIIHSL